MMHAINEMRRSIWQCLTSMTTTSSFSFYPFSPSSKDRPSPFYIYDEFFSSRNISKKMAKASGFNTRSISYLFRSFPPQPSFLFLFHFPCARDCSFFMMKCFKDLTSSDSYRRIGARDNCFVLVTRVSFK